MGETSISVSLSVEHLQTCSIPGAISLPDTFRPTTLLVPNLSVNGTVKHTVKQFVENSLSIPCHVQSLSALLFTKLSNDVCVEDLYNKYDCRAETLNPDIHVDEETYDVWAREKGKTVDLEDDIRLRDYHILNASKICLKILPEKLACEGGQIFVETKDGIIPLVAVTPMTRISDIKRRIQDLTGIPATKQLLSSIGRIMHDDFKLEDFEGVHAVYDGSIIDLCKSGDSNKEQAHRRIIVYLKVENHTLTVVVRPSDFVASLMLIVESHLGIPPWNQRIMFSGKILQDKMTLADYFIYPECTVEVKARKNSVKASLMEESAPTPAARKLNVTRTHGGRNLGTITIPILTTDKLTDLKRKMKISLHPQGGRNVGTAPFIANIDNHIQNNIPPLQDLTEQMQKIQRASSVKERLPISTPITAATLRSPSHNVETAKYFTPQGTTECFLTPSTKLETPHTSTSAKSSESVKSFFVRKLHFASPSSQCSTNLKPPPLSPLRKMFPQANHSNENCNENEPAVPNIDERKTIGYSFTEKMNTLKGHVKVPFFQNSKT